VFALAVDAPCLPALAELWRRWLRGATANEALEVVGDFMRARAVAASRHTPLGRDGCRGSRASRSSTKGLRVPWGAYHANDLSSRLALWGLAFAVVLLWVSPARAETTVTLVNRQEGTVKFAVYNANDVLQAIPLRTWNVNPAKSVDWEGAPPRST
jgi:hypothetical protein